MRFALPDGTTLPDEVAAFAEAAQSVFGECIPKYHHDNGHFIDLMSIEAEFNVPDTDDSIIPRLQLCASDSRVSFVAGVGYYRPLCRNYAMLQSVDSTSFVVERDPDLRGRMDELVEQFTGLQKGWANLTDVVMRLANTETTLALVLNEIFGDVAEETSSARTQHEYREELIVRRINHERNVLGRSTLQEVSETVSAWEAYNAIQGYTQHDMPCDGEPVEMERVILADKQPEVKAAEEYVLSLLQS